MFYICCFFLQLSQEEIRSFVELNCSEKIVYAFSLFEDYVFEPSDSQGEDKQCSKNLLAIAYVVSFGDVDLFTKLSNSDIPFFRAIAAFGFKKLDTKYSNHELEKLKKDPGKVFFCRSRPIIMWDCYSISIAEILEDAEFRWLLDSPWVEKALFPEPK
ncbi:MAG: hypothetical protein H6510_04495 [Acidobacteria bacterium]|nr:hypothetical protein [Acidobacteriota bacterium]